MTLSIWIQFNLLKTLQNTQTYLEQEREMHLSEILHSFRAQGCWNLVVNVSHQCTQDGVVIHAKTSAALSYTIFSDWQSIPRSCISIVIPYVTSISDQSLNIKKIIACPSGPIKKDHFFFISTFISLNHSRNIIIIVPFTESSYSPPRTHPGAPLYRCFLILLLKVAGCSHSTICHYA